MNPLLIQAVGCFVLVVVIFYDEGRWKFKGQTARSLGKKAIPLVAWVVTAQLGHQLFQYLSALEDRVSRFRFAAISWFVLIGFTAVLLAVIFLAISVSEAPSRGQKKLIVGLAIMAAIMITTFVFFRVFTSV